MNHHRTNISIMHVHLLVNTFNFPEHSVSNPSVQIIDIPEDGPNRTEKLKELEHYLIHTLKTLQQFGLNVSGEVYSVYKRHNMSVLIINNKKTF